MVLVHILTLVLVAVGRLILPVAAIVMAIADKGLLDALRGVWTTKHVLVADLPLSVKQF